MRWGAPSGMHAGWGVRVVVLKKDKMETVNEYVLKHCERGECTCGRCSDVNPNAPDFKVDAHTADLIFFNVRAKDDAQAGNLRAVIEAHVGAFCELNPFDGKEHNYIEIGGWIGDQGQALMLMGLGHIIGLWQLLTPRSVLGKMATEEMVQNLAGVGIVSIVARKKP